MNQPRTEPWARLLRTEQQDYFDPVNYNYKVDRYSKDGNSVHVGPEFQRLQQA